MHRVYVHGCHIVDHRSILVDWMIAEQNLPSAAAQTRLRLMHIRSKKHLPQVS